MENEITLRRGRPLKFQSPDDLATAIDNYFFTTAQAEYTITGLCLAIGTNKQVLLDYQNRQGYKDIVDEAKLIVENAYELSLRRHGRSGDIFALKNFGWRDDRRIDVGPTVMLRVNLTGKPDLSYQSNRDGLPDLEESVGFSLPSD